MRLAAAELAEVLVILEKIDQGEISPEIPGRVGRFLRQYGSSRARLDRVLEDFGLKRRADAAVSGVAVGTIELHPMLEPRVRDRGRRIGEVAETVAISEELGGLTDVVMWLKASVASTAYSILRQSPGLRLAGDYRWTPPARVTLGEAQLAPVEEGVRWLTARCLKAVADDLRRPPHALEYVLDYRLGPPGLKYFRCVCAVGRGREWHVLPGLGELIPLEVETALPRARLPLHTATLLTLLIYREPWSPAWTIVDGQAVGPEDALAHAITWADFQKELDGAETDGAIIAGIHESLGAAGVHTAGLREPSLMRTLLPVAREVLRWLRGTG